MWIKNSIIHRGKFEKLLEYGRDESKSIQEINNVRVCFSKEFRVGKGSDGTRVYVGLGRDGYERAVKRIQRDILCSAEQEKKALNERNAFNELQHTCNLMKPRVQLDDKQTERLASYFWVLQVYTM